MAADLGLPAALAVVGTDAWFCSNGQVIALSLTDGALTETGVACESIASDGTSLVVINGPPTLTAVYASPARALVSPPDATFSLIGATRAATDGRYWYGLRHAGGLLRTHDGATGAFLGTAPLEGFDGWVWGISALDGVLLVLDDGRPTRGGTWGEPTLRRFDPVSGAALGATSLGRTQGIALRGLWCSAS